MADISPELLAQINAQFEENIENNRRIKELLTLLETGKATYKEANEYAVLVGDSLARAYNSVLSSSVLPDGRMYYNIANAVVRPTLERDHSIIVDFAGTVQKLLNEKAGIGLNAIFPKVDQNRIQGILDRLAEAEDYDLISWILGEPVRNFSQNVVDETIKENAAFQFNSGMAPVIIRTAEAPGTGSVKRGNKVYKYQVPCKWCKALEGVYEYADVSGRGEDVFRRHEGCRCIIEYSPDGLKRQNVHTKQWGAKAFSTEEQLAVRKLFGLEGNNGG